jgi:hypothetical protein
MILFGGIFNSSFLVLPLFHPCLRLLSTAASYPAAFSCRPATSIRQCICLSWHQPLNAPLFFSGWLLHLHLVAPPPLVALLLSSASCRTAASCRLPFTASTSRPLAGCCTATSQTYSSSCHTPLVLLIILFTLAWNFQ